MQSGIQGIPSPKVLQASSPVFVLHNVALVTRIARSWSRDPLILLECCQAQNDLRVVAAFWLGQRWQCAHSRLASNFGFHGRDGGGGRGRREIRYLSFARRFSAVRRSKLKFSLGRSFLPPKKLFHAKFSRPPCTDNLWRGKEDERKKRIQLTSLELITPHLSLRFQLGTYQTSFLTFLLTLKSVRKCFKLSHFAPPF